MGVFDDCKLLNQATNLSVDECEKLTDGSEGLSAAAGTESDELEDGLRRAPIDFMVIMAKDATKDKGWALQMYKSLIRKGDKTYKFGEYQLMSSRSKSKRIAAGPRPEMVVPYVDFAKLLLFDVGYNPSKKKFEKSTTVDDTKAAKLYNPKSEDYIFKTLKHARYCLEAAIDYGDNAHFSARYRLADLENTIVPAAFDPKHDPK